jgi:hypothetical protein
MDKVASPRGKPARALAASSRCQVSITHNQRTLSLLRSIADR